jgi:hypothetical protein
MPSEADTRRTFVLPKLYAAGWTDERVCEQRIAEIMDRIRALLEKKP